MDVLNKILLKFMQVADIDEVNVELVEGETMQLDNEDNLLIAIKCAFHFFGKEEKEIDVHEMVLIIKLDLYIVIFLRSKCSSQFLS